MANNENLDALSHSRPNIVDSKGEPLGKASAKNAKTSKIFFIGIILFLFCCVIYLFSPFLMTITIGVLISVSTSGLHIKILSLVRNKRVLGSILTTLVLCAVLFVPFIYAGTQITKNIANFDMASLNLMVENAKNMDIQLPKALNGFEVQIKEFLANLDVTGAAKQAFSYFSAAGKSSLKFVADMVLIIIFCFFAYLYGADIAGFIKKIVPIKSEQLDYVFAETANAMSVVLYSTIFNAILQGLLFSIIAGIYGFNPMLMGVIFGFCSLIPAIGGALVYVPTALVVFIGGSTSGALIILIYCVVMISTIADSFIKPLVIKFINSRLVKNPAKINEILIFFSMLAGISTFGFWGVILGPAILTLFLSVLSLYDYLKSADFQ